MSMRRPWALPLLPLYWLGQRASDSLATRRTPKRLTAPVLSVGSLSAGGAGKTPVVLALATLLQQHGVTVDVLSRGYGRGSGAVERVDPSGPAIRYGDEPLEMAQAGLSVFVGANRFEAGTLAEASHPDPTSAHVHLLDDGFQHRQLWRTLDVVLLTLADAQDWLIPVGNLREPLAALRRAQVIVLREDEAQQLQPLAAKPVWIIRRTLHLPPATPRKLLAFCGIARPETFFASLRATPHELTGAVTFPDHHRYRREDLDRLVAAAHASGAEGLITTAKDAVKLTPADRLLLEQVGSLTIARLEVTFVDEDQVWHDLISLAGLSQA